MSVFEWVVGLVQLAMIGIFLVFIGLLIWDWIRSDTDATTHDEYEPRVHHDPWDDLGDGF